VIIDKPMPSETCPVCRAVSIHDILAKDYNRRISDSTFVYHHCLKCGLWFLHPIPASLDQFYPADYYAIPSSVEELAAAVDAVRYKIEIVQPFAAGGRLLEIGPACGDFAPWPIRAVLP
jgi:hypothetical protein